MELLAFIAFVAIVAFLFYLMINSIKESVERERFRKRNRETQYSGSAIKENQGFFSSVFSHHSRSEALGESVERRVSAYLDDLPCEEYRVYNDILIRDGNYTTQVDHIIISRETLLLGKLSGVEFFPVDHCVCITGYVDHLRFLLLIFFPFLLLTGLIYHLHKPNNIFYQFPVFLLEDNSAHFS